MAKPPKRKDLRPPGKCIFCGRTGLSKTHLWPDWLGRLLPFASAHTEESIQVSAPSAVGERHFIESRKRKQGKVFSLKRYVACEKCNTGWMANFEGEMVKFAKPIFTSNDNIRLNERQIRIFSVWITLITILAEYLPANNVGPIIS